MDIWVIQYATLGEWEAHARDCSDTFNDLKDFATARLVGVASDAGLELALEGAKASCYADVCEEMNEAGEPAPVNHRWVYAEEDGGRLSSYTLLEGEGIVELAIITVSRYALQSRSTPGD